MALLAGTAAVSSPVSAREPVISELPTWEPTDPQLPEPIDTPIDRVDPVPIDDPIDRFDPLPIDDPIDRPIPIPVDTDIEGPIETPGGSAGPIGASPVCRAQYPAIAKAAVITAAIEDRLGQMGVAVSSATETKASGEVARSRTSGPVANKAVTSSALGDLQQAMQPEVELTAGALESARVGGRDVDCATLLTQANDALAIARQHFRDGRKLLTDVTTLTTSTGSLLTVGYCDTADGSRTGSRVLGGASREPSEMMTPSAGAFVGYNASDGVYSGTADVYATGADSNVTVAAHIADDRAGAPIDLWSHLGIVTVIWSGLELPRAYQPMCYADDPGPATDAPVVGYIDTREQSGPNRPDAIAPGDDVPYANAVASLLPIATIEVSDIDLGAEENDEPNNIADDVDIQSTEHALFVGEAPRAVGVEAPSDIGLRIDDGLLRHVEDWADQQLTNLGNQLDNQITAINRVDHAYISNIDVDIDLDDMVQLPGGGFDTDESMLTLRASVDQIFVKLQKKNGKNCGNMTIGPISVEAQFTFDRSASGQNVLPRLENSPILDLGNLVLDQTAGWIGCATNMLTGAGDVSDVISDAFGGGLGGGGGGCSFWDYALGTLMLIGGVALAVVSSGIGAGAGVGLAAAGVNLIATCAFGIPSGFPSFFGLVWQVLTGVDITVDLGTVDLTTMVNDAIASVSGVNISSLLADIDGLAASLSLVDTCTAQGCDGGDILITPEGIEIVADANLTLSGTGGVSLPVTYNMPADVPDYFGGYSDGRDVRDVISMTSSISNQPIDLTLALGTDALNATFASLIAGGAIDNSHGDPDCNGDPVDQSFGALTYDIYATTPALVAAAPYTDPDNGDVLPLSISFHSVVIDVRDANDALVVSAYMDFNGGVGFDFNVATGVLTPKVDVDPGTLRVNYRDTDADPAGAVFVIPVLEAELQTSLPDAVGNLVGGDCGIQPFDLDGAISSLTDGSGSQLIDFDFHFWAEGFEGGVAIYGDVLAPFNVTAFLQSSNMNTGATTSSASVNFGSTSSTDFRWRHVLKNDFGMTIQSTPWSSWSTGDNTDSFNFNLPAPLPDMHQFPTAEIHVQGRDSFGRIDAGVTTASFFVPCASGGGGGGFDCFV